LTRHVQRHSREKIREVNLIQRTTIPSPRLRTASALFAIGLFLVAPANAQDTVRVGLIMPYSGTLSDTATQMDGGVKLYMQMHGDTVAGKKIEILRRDTG